MAKLSTEARAKLPATKFAGPGRSYPIPDKDHAKAAIIDINKGHLSPQQKAHVLSVARAMLHRGVK